MKKTLLIFLILMFQKSKAQYIYCDKSKSCSLDSITSLHFKLKCNYTPYKIVWKRNQNILKTTKNKYYKNYTRFFLSEYNAINPHNPKTKGSFGNYPYSKSPSNCFFNRDFIYFMDAYLTATINSFSGFLPTSFTPKNRYIYKKIQRGIIQDIYIPIDSLRPGNNNLSYKEDSFIRSIIQLYVHDTVLFIMAENIVKIDELNVSFEKFPKITLVNPENGRFYNNIPLMHTGFASRVPTSNDNLKYTNFAVMNDKLYLSYSYKNRDSLGIFDFKKNSWTQFIALNSQNVFPLYFHAPQNFPYYSPLGNSRVAVSKKNTIFIAEWLGDVYKFDSQFNKQILLYKKDSNLFGTIDENTRSFCVDGYDNLYLPDSKKGRVVRLEKDSSKVEILIDSFYGYCGVYYINTPDSTLFSPTNIQFDCNGNILMETERKDPTIVCDTRFHYKFESYIDDSILLNIPLNACDTLTATVFFIDGDSIVNIITKPPCYISKSLQINSCDSYNFNKKTYYQSGIFTDTIVSSTKPDTIYTLNLIINKSKHDTLKVETCNTYKFGDSTYSKSGTYTHKYIAKNGCDSFRTLVLTSKEVTGKIKLENGINYTALTPNATYQWYYCYPWRRITNAQNQTFSTTTKGSYAVVVSSLGCTDTSDCVALYSSGIQSLNQNKVQIFPNPIQDNFTIQFGNENKENSVEVYNALGQKIKLFNTKLNEIQVDMKDESRGIYLIKVNNENSIRIIKN